MSEISSPKHVCTQYRDGKNLNARATLHARYSSDPVPWFGWLFDHFSLPEEAQVLELGCGTGSLWRENLVRVPAGWQVTLSDFSEGMLGEAKGLGERFDYRVIDAQALPFKDATFDAVIANHMLYHVPDRNKAIAEFRRVLKAGGTLYASTIGEEHMRDLHDLLKPYRETMFERQEVFGFTLENGTAQLEQHFKNVRLVPREGELVVTNADDMIAYAGSSEYLQPAADKAEAFAAFVRERLAREGSIRIRTRNGLFMAAGHAAEGLA